MASGKRDTRAVEVDANDTTSVGAQKLNGELAEDTALPCNDRHALDY
jgi:hypothetical protein